MGRAGGFAAVEGTPFGVTCFPGSVGVEGGSAITLVGAEGHPSAAVSPWTGGQGDRRTVPIRVTGW